MGEKIPTFSVHLHCTACGGSRRLGKGPCHCVPENELTAEDARRKRLDESMRKLIRNNKFNQDPPK